MPNTEKPGMSIERLSTLIGMAAVIVSVAVTFGVQMERLSRLQEDVRELRTQGTEIMKAIGQIEHDRWRERRGER